MKVPDVDLSQCILCEICVEVCPNVFRYNEAGFIEVAELFTYPKAEVDEAVKNCPTDCIYLIEE